MYLPQKTHFKSSTLLTGMLFQFVLLTGVFVLVGKALGRLLG